jgi:pyruvate,water dikinase
MLGFRGIRRSFQEPELFKHELRAFDRLYGMGYDNLELMFPLVNDADDVERAVALMEEVGIDPDRRSWGVMVETPSSALVVEDLIGAGIDFVSMGTNDLTQYTLAVDRNNERVADRYDAEHPAVKRLLADVVSTCREHDVTTSICGEAASQPGMAQFLVEEGVTSISANIDAVSDVQQLAKRVEQRLLLDSVR